MLEKLNELKREWNHRSSRNTRLQTVCKMFSLLAQEKVLEPACFYDIYEVLFKYEMSLDTVKNEKVNTEKIENKVYVLYQEFIQSTKFQICKKEYAIQFREKNEQKLNQLYEKCIYFIHKKNGTKNRLQIMNYCGSFYREFTFLKKVLPVTQENSYMFLNLCLFFKQFMICNEEVSYFLNEKPLQKYKRKV